MQKYTSANTTMNAPIVRRCIALQSKAEMLYPVTMSVSCTLPRITVNRNGKKTAKSRLGGNAQLQVAPADERAEYPEKSAYE